MTADAPPSVTVLGFRPHTYWTAVVALSGVVDAPQVIERRRFEFARPEERFAYHRAAEATPATAQRLIEEARKACETKAAREIASLVDDLKAAGRPVRLAVVPAATAKLPEDLREILRSHSRIHAAEGSFSRDAIASACQAAGLDVRREVERELPALVGDLIGAPPVALAVRLKHMGAALGPPWSQDQQLAAMAAWLHLDSVRA